MGSDWTWRLALPGGALRSATVERLLELAEAFGLSPHRPDGQINGFDHEGDHRVLDRRQLVHGLTTGSFSTNLWDRSEADEWSLEQIWAELDDPVSDAPPPRGSWPEWLSWSTYFSSDHYRLLPPLPAELGADVRRTPDGAVVIALLADPAAVDVLRFARLHHEYRRAVEA